MIGKREKRGNWWLAIAVLGAACGGTQPADEPSQDMANPEAEPAGAAPEADTPEAVAPEPPTDEAEEAEEAPEEPATPAADEPEAASAPPPSPPKAEGAAEETRTTAVIQQVVLKNRQSVRDCYETERRKDPNIAGTLTMAFEIDPKGNVKFAKLNEARSTLKQESLVACAARAIKRLKFPPSSRGFDSAVNYPFDFKP